MKLNRKKIELILWTPLIVTVMFLGFGLMIAFIICDTPIPDHIGP